MQATFAYIIETRLFALLVGEKRLRASHTASTQLGGLRLSAITLAAALWSRRDFELGYGVGVKTYNRITVRRRFIFMDLSTTSHSDQRTYM
jgi:hypothetical protein